MYAIQVITLAHDPHLQQLAQRFAWILKERLSVPVVAAIVAVAMLAWVVAGVRLRGVALLLWLVVPLFAFAACVCVAGPGRLFRKQSHEGPVVIEIARKDAVTLLDVVGVSFAALAILLALALISWRVSSFRQQAAG